MKVRRRPEMEIRDAMAQDIDRLTELYMRGLKNSFFARLGAGFVRELLVALLRGRATRTRVLVEGGNVWGFITFSRNSKIMFRDALNNNGLRIVLYALRGMLGNPGLLPGALETFRYSRVSGRDDIDAEFIYISIDPECRKRNLSRELVGDALSCLQQAGAGSVKVSAEAANEPPQRLLISFGFKETARFTFHNLPMILFVIDPIPSGIADAKFGDFGGETG